MSRCIKLFFDLSKTEDKPPKTFKFYPGLYILLEGGDQRSPPKIFVWKV